MPFYVYILKCADGSYYTGSTNNLERRVWEHEQGFNPTAYTYKRRPVTLVWAQEVESRLAALAFEKQIKGWSRAKKEALIRGDWNGIHEIVRSERLRREKEKREKKNAGKQEVFL